jgi:RNase P subunit RPR2
MDTKAPKQVERKICRTCGAMYEVTVEEQVWMELRNMSLPTHCRTCRDKRKLEKRGAYANIKKDPIRPAK